MISEKIDKLQTEVSGCAKRFGMPEPKIVYVSKGFSPKVVWEAYHAGVRIFGESKVQEFLFKKNSLPQDVEWHFIGHLQSNKARDVVGNVALIHSVDSFKLALKIHNEAKKQGIVQDCLIQLNISQEKSKFGLSENELAFHFEKIVGMEHLRICGFMAIGPNIDDLDILYKEFKKLHDLLVLYRKKYAMEELTETSMGMSRDWFAAMQAGSTILRVGSSIFGKRVPDEKHS